MVIFLDFRILNGYFLESPPNPITTQMTIFRLLPVLLLTGCSFIKYHGNSDCSTDITGFSIGTDRALSGLHFGTDGKGAREIVINRIEADQSKAAGTITQGAVSGIIKGLK